MADYEMLPVEQLLFDKSNPRLVEFDSSGGKEKDIISLLWDSMNVKELVLSIAHSGYFINDPLVVAVEDGQNIVIEGNRRLAAVKILLNPGDYPWSIPEVEQARLDSLKKLPVVFMKREESWQFIGFKHVNGAVKWDSYAKARYIASVHNKHGIPLDEVAMQIGDTHKTIRKLYRGIMVIEQAEKKTEFKRDDIDRSKFSFSHLYTGLGYRGFSEFLDLKHENSNTDEFVPENKEKELEELFFWLYGSKKMARAPVLRSQNPDLRKLNTVVSSRESLSVLRNSGNLDQAYESARSVTSLFEEELTQAKSSLLKAKSHVVEGFDQSEELLRMAGTIANLAEDLYEEMERKYNSDSKTARRRKFTEDS